ncbi:MAG: porin family protein [Bacteroidetes bacterium]|nr:porin family protein [Bacteroidota bacterium]
MKSFQIKGTFIFFIFLISLIPSFSLHAQRFNGGLMAGGIVSQVDGDYYGGYNKLGYLGGGFVSLRVSPRSSFQMELEYIQKGSRINSDSTNAGNTYLMRFHYLEVPVLYQFTFAKKFSFETGPAMDVLLGSREESNGLETQSTIPLRNITVTGIIGASWFITEHLKVNFRINYSLMSIRQTAETYPASYRYIFWQKGQFNNLLSLSLLWYFKAREF